MRTGYFILYPLLFSLPPWPLGMRCTISSLTVYLQIVTIDTSFTGGLTVGMTACDPETLNSGDLPDDSDQLLDRPEYWVVHKDVITAAEVGDELSFSISNDGECIVDI